jgi:hypothetical protein
LEELAFLFEDRARAEEATNQVEKQMEWAEARFSTIGERMSWGMDAVIPNKGNEDSGRDRIEPHNTGQRDLGRGI